EEREREMEEWRGGRERKRDPEEVVWVCVCTGRPPRPTRDCDTHQEERGGGGVRARRSQFSSHVRVCVCVYALVEALSRWISVSNGYKQLEVPGRSTGLHCLEMREEFVSAEQ